MICSLIKRLIDWDTYPLEYIGVASNGTECLNMLQALKPDIVITDIRMPGLSGLDLIKKCVEQRNETRFIIISGYAQFDYAQQAIKYGVSDFLIKPIQKDELNESLARVIDSLEGRASSDAKKVGTPDLRHSFILSLLYNDFSIRNHPDMDKLNQAFGYHFSDGLFLPISICLDAKEEAQGHAQTILSSIEKILLDEIAPRCTDSAFLVRDNAIHALFQLSRGMEEGAIIALQYAFDRMISAIQPYDLYHVTMGRGGLVELKDLQESFMKAVCAVEGRRLLGLDTLYDGSMQDLRLSESSNIAVREPNHELITALQTLDTPSFLDFFLQEYQCQLPDMRQYPYSLSAYSKAFFAAFGRDVRKICGETVLPERQEIDLLRQIDGCLSKEEIIACLEAGARQASGEMQAARPDIKTIQIAKNYINTNYHQRITLEEAAKVTFLSPPYLGVLFKRETGQNFSDYLASVRLEKAKELLKNARLNVTQVADMVGYKDSHHFSKLFKRTVGISPIQYRKFLGVNDVE